MNSPTVFNSLSQRFECLSCEGFELPPAMPCEVRVFTKACLGFAKRHQYCLRADETPRVALSLRQPWAWLMIRPDLVDPVERAAAIARGEIKPIENRKKSWNFRGRLLVHAAGTMTRREYSDVQHFAANLGVDVPPSSELQLGGIIGEFTFVERVVSHPSPWFFGPYGYVVTDAKPLPFQPCKGALGFFTPKLPAA